MLSFEEKIVNYLKENVFTIENKKDPTWEQMCQKVAEQFIRNYLKNNKYMGELYTKLKSLKDTKEIQKLLKSYNIELSTAPKTKQGILEIFKDKIKKLDKFKYYEYILTIELMHKIATSGILTGAVVNAYWDRDYAHDNLGCPSEEYVKSDWETTIPVYESYEKFINKCKDAQMESKNQLTGYVGGKKVNITIQFDKKEK